MDELVRSVISADEVDIETLKFLDLPVGYVYGIPVYIPPPALLSILEMMDNPAAYLITDKEVYTQADVKLAIYTMISGKDIIITQNAKNLASIVEKWFKDRAVNEWDYFYVIENAVRGIDAGFKMIPSKQNDFRLSPRLYDADWLSWIVSMVSQVTNLSPDDIIWKTSVLNCGFYIAQYCRLQGIKVRREVDHNKLFKIFKEKRKWRN